ncbi:MAG: hypothetical protein ACREDK_02575 [Thermoplasmata archaeon]
MWALGQTWTLDLTNASLVAPDNLTVTIVRSNQLLVQARLSAAMRSTIPEFYDAVTRLAAPTVGAALTIVARIVDTDLSSSGSVPAPRPDARW